MSKGRGPAPPIPGGPSFCWVCRKSLGGHHQTARNRTWAVVVDKGGIEHRTHISRCLDEAKEDGARYLRKETEDATHS